MTKAERLILSLICDLQKPTEEQEFRRKDYEFISKAVACGHLWALDWEYEHVYSDVEYDRRLVKETVDILDMWDVIELLFERLVEDDKLRIAEAMETEIQYLRFRGFDGNNESEYLAIARFLVDDMGRWKRFKNRTLNSHYPSLAAHRRMLPVYKGYGFGLTTREFSVEQFIALFRVRRHPSNG